MNDTTFQGDGKITYVPVVVNAKPPKQTNADRIRSMTDEELAELLWAVWRHKDPFYKECVDGWLAPFYCWLRQEASE